MNLLKLSWKNLINKPLSMLLSLALFALGVGMISMLLLVNQQVSEKFDKNLAKIDMVIGAKGSPLQLILCSMYHIDNPTGNISLKEARPFLNPKHPLIKKAIPLSLGDSHEGYRIVGTTHDLLDLYGASIQAGTKWEHPFEVVVGAVVADKLGIRLGDKFHSSHGFVIDENLIHDDGEAFKVVGVLHASGTVVDQLILTSTQSVWAVHDHHDHKDEHHHTASATDGLAPGSAPTEAPHEHAHVHTATSLLEEGDDKEITSILIQFKAPSGYQALNMPRNINENTDMLAARPAWELNRLYDMMGVGETFLRQLARIIVLVSAFSIFISLFSSLKDRKYELALMRVMGASRFKLFLLIILEGLLLALVGYVIGIVFSHLGMELLATRMEDAYKYTFTGKQFLPAEWKLLGGALLIGFVAAIIPALQASMTHISKTLSKG